MVFLLLTILLVSVLPAYSVSAVSPNSLLRDGTLGAGGRSSGRISRALVTLEVALISIAMLVGSAVSVIAYRAVNVDLGMDTADLFMMQVAIFGLAGPVAFARLVRASGTPRRFIH